MLYILLKMGKQVWETGLTMLGLVWGVEEIAIHFFGDIEWVKKFTDNVITILIPAIIMMICKLIHILVKEFRIKCSFDSTKIIIEIGNLLNKKNGTILVGVNNQFKTKKSEIVKGSIHSQVVERYGERKMGKIFEYAQEKSEPYIEAELGGKEFVFLCMSDITNDGAASSTEEQVKTAVKWLFENQRVIKVDKNVLYMPLLGTGGGGLNLSLQDTVKLIVEQYLAFMKQSDSESISKIDTLHIVVCLKDANKIEWDDLRKWIEHKRNYCYNCNALTYLIKCERKGGNGFCE